MGVVVLSATGMDEFFDRIVESLCKAGIVHALVRHSAGDPIDDKLLEEADVLLAYGHFPCTEAVMKAAPRLRAVVSPWVGTDGFDIAAATRLGIAVVNSQPEEHSQSMAEATLMMILAASYALPQAQRVLAINGPRPDTPSAELLTGKTLGIVGFGQIGRRLAALVQGWSLTVKVHDPFAVDVPAHIEQVSLETLLQDSDIISLHTVLTKETWHLIDAERIRLMKPDAILVNTARGGLVDEAALFDAMSAGHLRGAALDVFETEPLPSDSPLRRLPNVLLTPHMIGQTKQSRAALVDQAVSNVIAVLSGQLPSGLRNPQVADAWLKRWSSNHT